MKAYCVGGPMDMQMMVVKDEPQVISFATTSMLPLWRFSEGYGPLDKKLFEVAQVVYRMVYKSRDGRHAVYVAEEAL